jgi:hypothetical protein
METIIRNRLLKLADFVEKLPDQKFDMYWWASSKKSTDLFLKDDETLNDRKLTKKGQLITAEFKASKHAKNYALNTLEVKCIAIEAKGDYRGACNTVMCLAGWTVFLFQDRVRKNEEIRANAVRLLGLNDNQAMWVFHDVSLTREKAAERLRMIANGDDPYSSQSQVFTLNVDLDEDEDDLDEDDEDDEDEDEDE